jgi:hypothetical protein
MGLLSTNPASGNRGQLHFQGTSRVRNAVVGHPFSRSHGFTAKSPWSKHIIEPPTCMLQSLQGVNALRHELLMQGAVIRALALTTACRVQYKMLTDPFHYVQGSLIAHAKQGPPHQCTGHNSRVSTRTGHDHFCAVVIGVALHVMLAGCRS